MTVSTRTSAPSYKIFEPDALDQIYAKGNLDPIMGGISYAFGSAHKQEAAGNQQQYLASQERFNKMAATLDAMEMDSKTKQAALKIGGELIAKGEDPTKIIGSDLIYGNPNDSLVPGLMRRKTESEINANNSKGAGGGEKDTYTESWTDPASGKDYVVKRQGSPSVIGPAPTKSTGTNAPAGSTPIASKAGTTNAQQIEVRAKAAAGPDAKIIQSSPSGATLWAGSKGTATFDPSGKQVR